MDIFKFKEEIHRLIIRFTLKIRKHLWALEVAFGGIAKLLKRRTNIGYWKGNTYLGGYKLFFGIEYFGDRK